MDIREIRFWLNEARKRALIRRSELYAAALLPHQSVTAIKSATAAIDRELYEIEYEAEIEMTDKMNAERIKAANERLRKAKEERRRKRGMKNG